MNKLQVNKAVQFLEKGKTILYPTDTVWGIGCDATNEAAIDSIYNIKQRDRDKSLILLVSDFEMLNTYVENISQKIKKYLLKSKEPITVIYKNPINLAKNVVANDDTIAIRIVNDGFVYDLIKEFGKPIVSTSANLSRQPTPLNYESIEINIINKVDFVVKLIEENVFNKPSKIIKFNNNRIVILRN